MRHSVKLLSATGSSLAASPLLAHGVHEELTVMQQVLHVVTNNQHLFAVAGGLLVAIVVGVALRTLLKPSHADKPSHKITGQTH